MNRVRSLQQRVDPDSALSSHSPESTIKFPAASIDAAALAILRGTLPPLEPITEEREIVTDTPRRRDTPHTIVLPMVVHADRPTLTMLGGPDVGATFALETDETILGRGSNAHVQLDESSISRRHASITRDDAGRYIVEDLGSTNGTFVCGRRVKRTALRSGDRVQLGRECVFRFAIVDQTEESFQRRLYESSMRDTLTGIANRRCLFERLTTEMAHARGNGADVAVVMFDVDHFKVINDTFGHLAGDQVLRAIALCGSQMLRVGDLFARYGGEEFAVIIRDATRDDAMALAERLRGAIARLRVEVGGGSVPVTVSVGVALLSECEKEDDGLELFARADARMYAAKLAGRNRVSGDA
jgi:two-component system cell cycle response regulator